MPGANSGRGRRGDNFTDAYPRTIPPEKEEPLSAQNWRLAGLHVDQAMVALRVQEKDTSLRDNIASNLNAALAQLYPKPAPE